ncbi:MAG: hypothetical protein VX874_19895 [Pseudomonadota bacterium]|nr:hypothetical protein [Pseudomonadota bacterium]
MSNPDSFIDEVTEEVRRDKLYALFRKWGWVGVLLVVVIVGGAAVNEFLKARDARQAQDTGDAVLAAQQADTPEARVAALDGVAADGDAAAVIGLIKAAEVEEPAQADTLLAEIENNADYPTLYRDLATLKRVMLPDSPMTAEDKAAALEPLLSPGAPFRVLAEEQLALTEIEAGDTEAALARLNALMDDAEAGDSLRERASQMIVALGGTVE